MATLSWRQLITELRALVKGFQQRSNHLDSGVEHLHRCVQQQKQTFLSLLSRYEANRTDFERYLHFDESGYTKNLVEDFNDTCNVIAMCWSPGQQSAFHAHEGSRCFVKVLAGQLEEQQVAYPSKESISGSSISEITRVLNENQVTYIDDSIGLHKVTNRSPIDPAVTLHVYLPAYKKCRIFSASEADEISLEESYAVEVNFKTKNGQIVVT